MDIRPMLTSCPDSLATMTPRRDPTWRFSAAAKPPNTGMEPTAHKTRRGSCPDRYAA
jgi:hypothetical protein